jgi:hypothetical protein
MDRHTAIAVMGLTKGPHSGGPISGAQYRLLVLLVLRAGLAKRQLGLITDVQPSPSASGRQRVAFDGRVDAAGEHDYDLVVLRHGPPGDFFAQAFRTLADDCKELGGTLADLGITGALDPETDAWYRG